MKSYILALACFAIVALGCKANDTASDAGAGAAGSTGVAGKMGTAGTTGTAGTLGTSGSGGKSATAGTGGTSSGGKGGSSAGGSGTSAGGKGGSSAGGSGGTAAGGTGGAGGSGAVSAACKTYCACMPTNCSMSKFPTTCEAFCATGSDTAVSCWNTHCTNAATMGKDGVHCTHALGDGTVCPKK